MNCYRCGCALNEKNFCTSCGADVGVYKKIVSASNALYNDGLEKAKVRDLSGAIVSLQQSLKLNNNNIDARNLLGLIYFEMGETVQALNQWVISKNFRAKKNIADDYIDMIQNNPNRLDNINQTVKKFNQALNYCRQDSLDLAVIQLKKVLSLNSKYVQAHQLLALLYMNNEEWDKAKRELAKCQKIDINNTITLRYMQEVDKMLVPDEGGLSKDKKKDKDLDSVVYQSGNETIIQPSASGSPLAAGHKGSSILNILIGIIIGALVVWFLIVPTMEKNSEADLQEEISQLRLDKSDLDTQVAELNQRVQALSTDNQDLTNQISSMGGTEGIQAEYDKLLSAVNLYVTDPTQTMTVAESLFEIDTNYLQTSASEGYMNTYNNLKGMIATEVSQAYYEEGLDYYNDEYYDEAITVLAKAFFFDETAEDALYLLGNAYRMQGNNDMAIETYSRVVELFPDTRSAGQAQGYIDELSNSQ